MTREQATDWQSHEYVPTVAVLSTERLTAYLGNGDRVLELGCGRGSVAHSLAKRGCAVTGIDINASAITEARTVAASLGLADCRFIVGNVLRDAGLIESKGFEAVLLIRFLTCFPDERERRRLLEIAGSALKPGSVLYLRDFLLSAGYCSRYDAAVRNGLAYWNFPVQDSSGNVAFVAHHNTESEVREMMRGYERLIFEVEGSPSMNGNPCTVFEFIGTRHEDSVTWSDEESADFP
jgi:SAM-dependent methyltransferase